MIRVDVDQARVKAHRPFKQRDQRADGAGVHGLHGNGDRLPVVRKKRFAGAQQESVEIVARSHARLNFMVPAPRLQHSNERDEEIVYAVPKLLHVGMLIGGALVSVHANPLVDALPVQVQALAKRFHHQLLQVAAEQQQPILIRKHHHVLGAAAIGRLEPHQRQHGRRIQKRFANARGLVACRRPFEHRADIDALQRGGQQPHR